MTSRSRIGGRTRRCTSSCGIVRGCTPRTCGSARPRGCGSTPRSSRRRCSRYASRSASPRPSDRTTSSTRRSPPDSRRPTRTSGSSADGSARRAWASGRVRRLDHRRRRNARARAREGRGGRGRSGAARRHGAGRPDAAARRTSHAREHPRSRHHRGPACDQRHAHGHRARRGDARAGEGVARGGVGSGRVATLALDHTTVTVRALAGHVTFEREGAHVAPLEVQVDDVPLTVNGWITSLDPPALDLRLDARPFGERSAPISPSMRAARARRGSKPPRSISPRR